VAGIAKLECNPFFKGKCFVQLKPPGKIINDKLHTPDFLKDMPSWSMGISNALVAWVQMISPLNPASIRSGTLPM